MCAKISCRTLFKLLRGASFKIFFISLLYLSLLFYVMETIQEVKIEIPLNLKSYKLTYYAHNGSVADYNHFHISKHKLPLRGVNKRCSSLASTQKCLLVLVRISDLDFASLIKRDCAPKHSISFLVLTTYSFPLWSGPTSSQYLVNIIICVVKRNYIHLRPAEKQLFLSSKHRKTADYVLFGISLAVPAQKRCLASSAG